MDDTGCDRTADQPGRRVRRQPHTSGRRFDATDPSTDYCGACGRVSIRVGGAAFAPGPAFTQRLSLAQARCTVTGDGVQAECWVAADHDVLVLALTDVRDAPAPVEVTLRMWRAPELRHGEHSAAYEFRHSPKGTAAVQVFREAEHFCASAVSVSAVGGEGQTANGRISRRTMHCMACRPVYGAGVGLLEGPDR